MKFKTVISLAILIIILIICCGSASAATINVNPGPNAIGNAINNAQSGDTLSLSSGTYPEYDLMVDKDLTITGPETTGPPTAIIDAQDQGRVFNINSGVTVTLKYLTITQGTTAENGGGIHNSGTLNVISSNIYDNTANYGGGIYNSECSSLTITGSTINENTAASGGGIYISPDSTLTITGSTINNNDAASGGGISNTGSSNVIDSNLNGNTAASGGGIINAGTLTVTGSTINGNTASKYGGGIYNYQNDANITDSNIYGNYAEYGGGLLNTGKLIINNSKISFNTATTYDGGGIANYDNLTVTGCDASFNNAHGNGNAIYNEGGDITDRIVHFNRFYDPATGYEIYSVDGTVDANYNWWSSDQDPISKVSGIVYTNPWLKFNLNANPNLIGKNLTSNITADLWYDSNGTYHDPAAGHVPDDIQVIFSTTLGTINSPISMVNGAAIATLNGGSVAGTAEITAVLDNQINKTSVLIETTPPTVTSFDPVNGAVNVASTKVIRVTFSEAVKAGGNYWIELKNRSGTLININKSITGNVLTITPTIKLPESRYSILIHTGAVTDLAGNPIALITSKFSTGTSPRVSYSDPKSGATGVARNKVIKVTFNENIKAGSNYWIELVASNGKKVTISKSISGRVLTIKHTALLKSKTKYYLKLHTGCVTDLAGNPLAAKTISFTTRST